MRHPEVRAGQLTDAERARSDARQYCFRLRRRATHARRRIGAATLIAIASAGCYRYVPISPASAAGSTEVRIRITDDAAARLSKDFGAFVTELDGKLSPQGADSVSVAIPIERQYNGMTVGTTSQVLYLGRKEVVEVRKREFDRARTILVSAGAVVGFGLLAAAVVQLADPNPDSQDGLPPPPPSPSRVPHGYRFTLRIPIP